MILNRSKCETKEDYFWFIYNNLGCKDLSLCYSYIKEGEVYFSKWWKYEDLLNYNPWNVLPNTHNTKEDFIKLVSHRTILDIEILIDIDEKGKYKSIKNKAKQICNKLKRFNIPYSCLFTGSKGYHISILMPKLRYMGKEELRQTKQNILKILGADTQKSSIRSMIALEGHPHYKSGILKEQVEL